MTNPKAYFLPEELRCDHCHGEQMDEKFLSLIVELKERLKIPFPILVAYRCPKHPLEFFMKGQGPHQTGRAIRVGLKGVRAYKALREALSMGFLGIGVHNDYIHLDMIERPEGPLVWPER